MAINIQNFGPNSAMIEYSNSDWVSLMDLIDGFITTHGWTKVSDDASGATGVVAPAKAYKSTNSDGVSEKEIIIGLLNDENLAVLVMENYNPVDDTYENL